MILGKRVLNFYDRFISLRGEPAQIASGFALGVFVGVTPTIPLHTAIILLLGFLFRQNITAAYLGSWLISNPLTIPVLYISQYEFGRFLLGMERCTFEFLNCTLAEVAAMGWKILLPLQTGGILMAPFIAVPAYYVARRLITSIRARGKR